METDFFLIIGGKGKEIRIKVPNNTATNSTHILSMINCVTSGKLLFCALTGRSVKNKGVAI